MKLAILDCLSTQPVSGGHVGALPEWRPQAGALDAVAQLNRGGWKVTLVSQQPGVGCGHFDCYELHAAHVRMQQDLAAAGARIEAVFFCPHLPEQRCACRTPAPGLLQQIASRYGAQPQEVWVIGQTDPHLEAGKAMGAHVLGLRVEPTALPWALGQNVPLYDSWQTLADALAPEWLMQPPAEALD